MPEQIRKQSTRGAKDEAQTPDKLPHAEHKSGDELRAEMDAILDDIDEALEADGLSTEKEAQDWVGAFVQGGGE